MISLRPRTFYRPTSNVFLYKKGYCSISDAKLGMIMPYQLIYVVKEEADFTSRYIVIYKDQIGVIQQYMTSVFVREDPNAL